MDIFIKVKKWSCKTCGGTERYKDGHCANCARAASKRNHAKNREKNLAGMKTYGQTPERKQANAKWYAANKIEIAEKRRANHNPEKQRAYNQAYYAKNGDKLRADMREYAAAHPEESRDRLLKRKYGIVDKDYRGMLAEQGGKCAICTRMESEHGIAFSVDHDHETGKIRGLLCRYCNPGLGHFGDDPELLAAAIEYLHKHRLK